MPGLRLPEHRMVRPLPRLLAFQFIRERRQRQHDLAGGGVERPFPIFGVEKYADAGLEELLERLRRRDGLTTEARFLAHDQHLKGWTRC